MLNQAHLRQVFNRAAKTKNEADFLGREVVDRLMDRMPLFRLQPQRILEYGARTKDLSGHLRQRYSDAEIVAVDCAEQQLAEIQDPACFKAASHYASLPFAPSSFDMVISSLALNWTNDFAACFRDIKRVLKPNGLFIFTLFGVETLKELRHSFAACREYLYLFPDMHNVGDLLLQCDFDDPVMEMETITVRYKKLDTLFQDLKLTGNSNVHLKRPRGLFGKNRWREAIKHYEALKDSEAYPATVEIIYGHAWKAEEQEEKAGNEVFVSINSIR